MVLALLWVPPIRLQLAAPTAALERFAVACARAPLSDHPRDRLDAPPRLWHVSDREEVVGRGAAAYARAEEALLRLECMQLPWLRATVQGDVLAICSRQFGLVWLMNANRMARPLPPADSSAAVGWDTTIRHVLAGEERLSVRWDRESDAVVYRVRSYSQPRHAFSVLTYPVVRLQQRRFAHDSAQKMRLVCDDVDGAEKI